MPKLPLAERVSPQRAALIVVDMQNDYCSSDGSCAKGGGDVSLIQAAVPVLNGLIESARAAQVPVIFIQTIYTDETNSAAWTERHHHTFDLCRPGTDGIHFYGVSPRPNDIIVNKHRYSAFMATRLDHVLHTLKRDAIILTGVATNVCVESTARDGCMMDYYVTVVSNCCGTVSNPAAHEASLDNVRRYFGTVATADEIAKTWSQVPALVNA